VAFYLFKRCVFQEKMKSNDRFGSRTYNLRIVTCNIYGDAVIKIWPNVLIL